MKKDVSKYSFLVITGLFLLFISVSCVSHPYLEQQTEELLYPCESYIPESFEWQEVESGIARFDFKNPDFPIIYHAVKINLDTPDLEIISFPDSEFVKKKSKGKELSKPFIYKGITTEAFARKNKCTVAVNATPFAGRNGKWDLIAHVSSTRQLVGVHIYKKFEVSAPVASYSALSFTRTESGYKAEIIDSQTSESLKDSDYAFGGFFTVLRDGQINEKFIRNHDSRTGCGVSQDGKTLYILVVEGEVGRKSEGLSYPQCAAVFKAMGCDDALEFDGGGSSQLCINGKSVLTYRQFRVQGNSFGVRKM